MELGAISISGLVFFKRAGTRRHPSFLFAAKRNVGSALRCIDLTRRGSDQCKKKTFRLKFKKKRSLKRRPTRLGHFD